MRLYNYYELILVLCIWLLVTYFCQQSLIVTNGLLLLPTVFVWPAYAWVCWFLHMEFWWSSVPFLPLGLDLFGPSGHCYLFGWGSFGIPAHPHGCSGAWPWLAQSVVCCVMWWCLSVTSTVMFDCHQHCLSPLVLYCTVFTLLSLWGKWVACFCGGQWLDVLSSNPWSSFFLAASKNEIVVVACGHVTNETACPFP